MNNKIGVGYKPNSVPACGPWSFLLDAGHPAPPAIYPETSDGQPSYVSLFDLASGGVCPAFHVTMKAVSSYLTISPLPAKDGRCIFCGTFPRSLGVRVTNHPALWSSDFPLAQGPAIMRPLHIS